MKLTVTIEQFLPWILPCMVISGVISFIKLYVDALIRTHPSHRYYVPPEKRVWGILTRGDIYGLIYMTIWLPTFLFLSVNILGPVYTAKRPDIYTSSSDIEIPFHLEGIVMMLLFAGPLGAAFISKYIDDRY